MTSIIFKIMIKNNDYNSNDMFNHDDEILYGR